MCYGESAVCLLKVIKNVICALTVSFLFLAIIPGCSDDPEGQAQEQLHKSTSSALDLARDGLHLSNTDDSDQLQQASDNISSAISKNRSARNAVSSATFAKANITFAQAQKLRSKLQLESVPITEATGRIALINSRTGKLTAEKNSLQDLVKSHNEQIDMLNQFITKGIEGKPGLKTQVQGKAAELADLQSQKVALEDSRDNVKFSASEFQGKANLKFRQAETAKGEEKVTLSNEGFELLRKSNAGMVSAQEFSNQIQVLESEIGVIKPLSEKLRSELKSLKGQINELQNSPDFAKLESQLTQVSIEYKESQTQFRSEIKKLVELKKSYAAVTEESAVFLKSAITDYKNVVSGQLRSAALERVATSSFWVASIYSDNAILEKHVASAIEFIYPAVKGTDASELNVIVQSCNARSLKLGKQAFEYFDIAAEKYEQLAGSVSGEHSCNIIKRCGLALFGKLALAEKLGQYDASDKASEQLEVVLENAKKCDPDYSRTVLARIINGKTNSVSVLPVDNTSFYEDKRKMFLENSWIKLPVEERADAVKVLIATLDEIEQEDTFDRQAYERILGPERIKLENAIKRGFEDIEDDAMTDANLL